jgi:hypothetical protein
MTRRTHGTTSSIAAALAAETACADYLLIDAAPTTYLTYRDAARPMPQTDDDWRPPTTDHASISDPIQKEVPSARFEVVQNRQLLNSTVKQDGRLEHTILYTSTLTAV